MKLKTPEQLKKYIKRTFGLTVNVKIKHHFWGGYWGMACYDDNCIEIHKKALKSQENFVSVIWHEAGHFHTYKLTERKRDNVNIKREANAHIWALRKAKQLNKPRIYNYLIEDLETVGWKWRRYRRARKIVMNKLKNNDLTLIK